jgi:hypothetical protein
VQLAQTTINRALLAGADGHSVSLFCIASNTSLASP